ncbi:MAG: D-glycero-beta-D-manno-heptose 1-phosphate adenylyltransferase [Saprospiraceae bacterium]|nr:D-glycero-beta-D-manno-heptose 1-phosphate adenylyltransferase [Saprospiraceae bacterium]
MTLIKEKIYQSHQHIKDQIAIWKASGKKIVFTNGCFDLVHVGHVLYLENAAQLGDILVVGLNSDDSVRRLKGPTRPINDILNRSHVLAALASVDAVIIFEEDTPLNTIHTILPDVLVKGGDWKPDQIVGSDLVLEHGGQVLSLNFVDGYSTTQIENKIIQLGSI